MLPIERGLEIVMSTAKAKQRADWMPAEPVALLDSIHRILREDVFCDADSPRFDKAIRDGFAVRFEDLAQVPAVLDVIGESRAGAGANAVVMVEKTERLSPSSVRIMKGVHENEGLLRRGAEARQGDKILYSG